MNVETVSPWPDLPLEAWRDTRDTLHMWTQIVGKTLLSSCAPQNHWWHVALRVTARGLATPPVTGRDCSYDVEFDFVDHRLLVRTSDGREAALALEPRTVRSFYREYLSLLDGLDLPAKIWTRPVEVVNGIPFELDEIHRRYEPLSAHRFWQVLRRCDATFRDLATDFTGKQSPVHFFWGSFDLAATRFSGRRAAGPASADPVTREGYSHEVISFGFWPGGITPAGVAVNEPVFYAYAAPEPPGFKDVKLRPAEAHYDHQLNEFILPYRAVRAAREPGSLVRAFCEGAYVAGATLGRWERSALERDRHVASELLEDSRHAAQ
jgi:Family of unknown function (DUF5996)